MPKIEIDGKTIQVDSGINIFQACELIGISILDFVITAVDSRYSECAWLKWKVPVSRCFVCYACCRWYEIWLKADSLKKQEME